VLLKRIRQTALKKLFAGFFYCVIAVYSFRFEFVAGKEAAPYTPIAVALRSNLSFPKKIQIGDRTMFDNTNPYTLRTEIVEGITHYYVSFTDGQAILREIEVSRPVYLEFQRFIKQERNLRRSDERHMEEFELTDEMLHNHALNSQKSVEDEFFDSQRDERLWQAIMALPEIQRRRFILYYEFGLTYEQIARMEGRNLSSVFESIQRAESKVKEKIKNIF